MDRRTALIISLIVSVISLLYLIFGYFGATRWVQLHFYPIEAYTKTYPNLEKADDKRVVVSFSASGEELKHLKPFLNSILDQTVRVDDIALTVPYKDIGKIPADVKKVLTVNGYSKDYESASNLVCSVLREPESTTKILLVDPSIIYGADFIEAMVDGSNENKSSIIYANSDFKQGILIKPQFFDDAISDYKKGTGCCAWLDSCSNAKKKTQIGYNNNYKSIGFKATRQVKSP